jgi:mercuric ion binding protein
MKTILKAVIFAGSVLAATSAFAEEQTVTLEVSGMSCASCPYIVKQTLSDVDGVTTVEISFSEKSALVTYDDSQTEVAALTAATAAMGFPSTLKE